MHPDLVTIPCLEDNYAFLVGDAATGDAALVDAPEAGPVLRALALRGWRLTDILLTHHHGDHVAGVPELVAATGARVTGAAADSHRLPPLDRRLAGGDRVEAAGRAVEVIGVPGHTTGHIAFHMPAAGLAFTGDSLMAMGCGRLFEGTAAQMWDSLGRLAQLPAATLVCSGHEYTQANMRFALALDPADPVLRSRSGAIDEARAGGAPTVPSPLSLERATNPFLRCADPAFRAAAGLAELDAPSAFAVLRARKDAFRG